MSGRIAPPYKTFIIDDEPMARATLRLLLSKDADIEISGEFGNGFEAAAAIRHQRPALIFLDVQMPEMDGFAMLQELDKSEWPQVVFVTAYEKYALKAFEVNALDYLLKPFDDARFQLALNRAKEQLAQNNRSAFADHLGQFLNTHYRAEQTTNASGFLQRLAIKTAGRIRFIKVSELDWIEAADQYVKLHSNGDSYLIRQALGKLETQLDPQQFCRIHRSAIVNIEQIEELLPTATGDYTVVLRNKTRLKLSRHRRQALQALIPWLS